MYQCIYTDIHTERERGGEGERERERERDRESSTILTVIFAGYVRLKGPSSLNLQHTDNERSDKDIKRRRLQRLIHSTKKSKCTFTIFNKNFRLTSTSFRLLNTKATKPSPNDEP